MTRIRMHKGGKVSISDEVNMDGQLMRGRVMWRRSITT